jgi:hypothetical protein
MPEGKIVSEALIKPLGDVLMHIGRSVAEAQRELDRNSADTQIFIENDQVLSQYDLRATWYHMPEIDLDLKISLSLHEEIDLDTKVSVPQLFGATLDASYAKKYDYEVEGSSQIKVKIVSIPPPSSMGI